MSLADKEKEAMDLDFDKTAAPLVVWRIGPGMCSDDPLHRSLVERFGTVMVVKTGTKGKHKQELDDEAVFCGDRVRPILLVFVLESGDVMQAENGLKGFQVGFEKSVGYVTGRSLIAELGESGLKDGRMLLCLTSILLALGHQLSNLGVPVGRKLVET